MWDPGEFREGKIRVSTGKGRIQTNVGEDKIWVSTGKGRIRASIEEGKIRVSTGNVGSGRIPGR